MNTTSYLAKSFPKFLKIYNIYIYDMDKSYSCFGDKKWKQVQHQGKIALKANLMNMCHGTYTCTIHTKEKEQDANSR